MWSMGTKATLPRPESQEDLSKQEILDGISLTNHVNAYLSTFPKGLSSEDYRTVCSLLYGYYQNKSFAESLRFYSLDKETAAKYWEMLAISGTSISERKKRGSKASSLEAFLKENIGKVLKSSEILEACDITNPTLYNFINANRGYFKKIGRGVYEILDKDAERSKEKNASSSKK